ncbi:PREDICTED: N-acetylglucosamine-1-phosphodiester alpha-N-acetylglucosaminidase-like [Amphimedon queenslandica]|uniref:Phosphodiester glycosidase domain-containing protein n=1 Tax=Amphimedon queenslandica TaxID=400682 RepID=A0A1X7VKD5_AMPQE|nr:PREDICTED: N-acetylglucosamine-1-phosphodiester alpha-N-acetylglucosaminidase-like [Amphimedon queenslandica]|eukprot:XP_019848655.1 PREDICTED: N-acetylglucosamine-1-phosphodiester alpha-N-acetylglucosaminidase-like [Amphimedon queenslandica]
MKVTLMIILSSIATSLALISPFSTQYQLDDDYVVLDYHNVSIPFSNFSYKGIVSNTNRSYTAFVAVLPSGVSSQFSFELPKGGCGTVNLTSLTSKENNCNYSTNAGYFNTKTNSCVGNIITNGKTEQLAGQATVNFAITSKSYVLGYLTNKTLTSGEYNWTQLISGFGWIVRRGEDNVKKSIPIEELPDTFVTEKAPRTGICVARNGTLILAEVDGEEDIKAGLDLYEFSEVLIDLGCWEAVNLDGGGSSTSVYRGTVINKPTCSDSSDICERHVSSITCIKLS